MGVHLTINAEWSAYRWGPISTRDPASGLLDDQGYFYDKVQATVEHADPAAVAGEMQAQVARALQAGIDATHVDAHMGTVLHPPFLAAYLEVAQDHRLPPFFVGGDAATLQARGVPPELVTEAVRHGQALTARSVPLFDALTMLPLDDPADHIAVTKQIIAALQPGLTMLILHPAQDTPELRALAPDWRCRVANYAALLSTELRDYVRQSGVQVIGYLPLRELLRASS